MRCIQCFFALHLGLIRLFFSCTSVQYVVLLYVQRAGREPWESVRVSAVSDRDCGSGGLWCSLEHSAESNRRRGIEATVHSVDHIA